MTELSDKLQLIHNHILFQFEDQVVRRSDNDVSRTQFLDTTSWGFEISSYDESTRTPRWGIVRAVGSKVPDEIRVGSRILIEPLRWTPAVEVDGQRVWRTDSDSVMLIDES